MVSHLPSHSRNGGDRMRRAKLYRLAAHRKRNHSGSITVPPRRRRRHQSDWSHVNCDILERVQRKLPLADALTSRAVCNHWRPLTQSRISSSLNSPPPPTAKPPPPHVLWIYPPLIFHPSSLGGNNFYKLNPQAKQFFIHPDKGYCVGFSHGWFLFMDSEKNNILYMFHPNNPASALRFPPIVTPDGFTPVVAPKRAHSHYIRVIFWADPILGNSNYGIVVNHPLYKNLIFAKSGSTQFADLSPIDGQWYSKWKDLICFQNHIYAVGLTEHNEHLIEAWDCSRENATPTKVLDCQPKFSSVNQPIHCKSTLYLAELEGHLLLVSIQRPDSLKLVNLKMKTNISYPELFVLARSPDTVRVYKMDFNRMEWVQMHSLGDRVLFVMKRQNVSFSTREFPQYKRNTVYFWHEIRARCLQRVCIGVFNMEDGSMEEMWPPGSF